MRVPGDCASYKRSENIGRVSPKEAIQRLLKCSEREHRHLRE